MHTDSMRITLDQIVDELVERIYRIKHGDIAPVIELVWHEQIHRRIADLESSRVPGIPVEETLARMRAIVSVGEFAGG